MFTDSKSIPSSRSTEVFLQGLFDDAGLFPPTALSMPRALLNYANHRTEEDYWMTGPFVCPVARLEELIGEKKSFEKVAPILLSLLPGTAANLMDFESSFRLDVEQVERLRGLNPDTFDVAMMEIRVPPDVAAQRKVPGTANSTITDSTSTDSTSTEAEKTVFDRWLSVVLVEIEKMKAPPERIFLEVSREGDYQYSLEAAVRSISLVQSADVAAGLKIRCGGKHQNDYPSSVEIAQFLKTVISSGQFFKATAGLHHPVRHYNASAEIEMHGFLNVFFAAFFCAALDLDIESLVGIIDEKDPSRFKFVDEGIRFDNYFVSTDTLQQIRTSQVLSIGSCSFDEPREDLRALSWLVAG